jgi:glycosyltransferase involved in cell wall biosynthesis
LTTPARLRLAFTHIPRERWAGGYNYLRNLFGALARYQPHRFTPVVFAASSDRAADIDELMSIEGVEVVLCDALDQRLSRLASALLWGLDRQAATVFSQQRIDVVVEIATFYGWRLAEPALAWFPDMQHRRLPHLFSRFGRVRRELGFRMQIASGRTVLLSSEDARRDCERFYPSLRNRTSVVRFATEPESALLNVSAEAIHSEYDLPAGFFYLPNQFWVHKNHRTVLDALSLLSARSVEVVIAATGNPEDPRQPGYSRKLMKEVVERHLTSNFRYIGMLPRHHVYALMRNCSALINPSRFEGWSTTVEEAKSFGVPMILSDLDVHREQTQDGARYFGVDDAAGLAGHLEAVAAAWVPAGPRDLLPGVHERMAAFAAEFAATIERARRRG